MMMQRALLSSKSNAAALKQLLSSASSSSSSSSSARSITTGHLTRYTPLVEIITDKLDPRKHEIYRLRHDVLAKAAKTTVFTDDHPLVFEGADGFEIADDLDAEESTTHYAVRGADGKICAAVRAIDANRATLDMEKNNWFQLPKPILDDGAVELCRLVNSTNARGTNAVPLLCQQVAFHQQDIGNTNFVFMVNARAPKLIDYYKKWTTCELLSTTPVSSDIFEKSRKSHVLNMPMGLPGTLERARFTAAVIVPCAAAVTFMKSYKTTTKVGSGSKFGAKKDLSDVMHDFNSSKKK